MLILLYHGVRPSSDVSSPDIRQKHVPEAAFRAQMRFLAKRFSCVSLDDVLAVLAGRKPWDDKAVAVTFDDGYANNAEVAAPLLRELSIPATFFLTTGFLDGTHRLWVDRFEVAFRALTASLTPGERARQDAAARERLKRLPVAEREQELQKMEAEAGTQPWPGLYRPMTWDDARHVQRDGFTLGAHTMTHPNLSRLTADEQEREIVTSKRRIEEETKTSCTHFAFPNGQPGDWDAKTLEIVKRAGFVSCATTVEGAVTKNADPFLLPRVTVDTGDDLFKFRLTVTGWRSTLRRLRQALHV